MSVLFHNKIKIVNSKLENYSDECLVNPLPEYILSKKMITTDYIDTLYDNYISYHKINVLNAELVTSTDVNYPLYLHINVHDVDDFKDEYNYNLIEENYYNIFKIVRNYNIKSLTITPFGAGTYGLHNKEFASVSIDEINKYLKLNPYIKKVTLIVDSEQDYNIYQNCLNEKLIKLFKKL